ncbi:MAG: nucleotidyltransferase [Planctomycetota bacterium]
MPFDDGVAAAFHRVANLLKGTGEGFVVIGGLAVEAHAIEAGGDLSEMTNDVDLLLQVTPKSLISVAEKLARDGFDIDPSSVAPSWSTAGFIHVYDHGTRIDLMEGASSFRSSVFERAGFQEILGQRVRVATLEDCIVMKCIAWRPKDIFVVSELVRICADSIDRRHLLERVQSLEEDQPQLQARVESALDPSIPQPPAQRED